MKRYFPQLSSGTLAQFPLTRSIERRTIVNRLPGGSTIRLADPDAALLRWELRYAGLSDAERKNLETFFRESEGRLTSFVFLDPCSNLLAWSEDFSHDVWTLGGLLTATPPEGGVIRLTNASQTSQSLHQTVAAPAWFRYCIGAQVRAEEPCEVRFFTEAAGQRVSSASTVTGRWSEGFCSAAMESQTEEVTCGIEVPAGRAVEIRAMTLQAQPGLASFRKTTARNGIFTETRFDTDTLEFQANGVNDHSAVIRLISRADT